jgi:hypothetical protein
MNPLSLNLMKPHTDCCLHMHCSVINSAPMTSPAHVGMTELMPCCARRSVYAYAGKGCGGVASQQASSWLTACCAPTQQCCGSPEMTAGSRGTGPFRS